MNERDIFIASLDYPNPEARNRYLDVVCAGDRGLRERVEAMLHSHESGDGFVPNRPPSTSDLETATIAKPNDRPEAESSNEPLDLSFLQPSQQHDSLGRLAHYEILQILGKGGFGLVFRAFDTILRRIVAVKVLHPQLAATSAARKRFLRESRSSAKVRHENVVQIYEIGEQPLPYLVMEYIPGETLQQRIERTGPMDILDILRIGQQIGLGLEAAHQQGLIHRDIKPGNVMIEGAFQRAKITDFGLARAADDASISNSGLIAGTPMFMAPEQALGEELDQRADLFSFGSVLYNMITGRPPFRATTTMAVLKRVAEQPPRPIRELIPETPRWLCDIVAKMQAKKRDERFQTAREIVDVLAACEHELQLSTQSKKLEQIIAASGPNPRPQRRHRAAVWLGLATMVMGIIALVVLLLLPKHREEKKIIVRPPEPKIQAPEVMRSLELARPAPNYQPVPKVPILADLFIRPQCFSPDGKWLITLDGMLGNPGSNQSVWDVSTSQRRTTLVKNQNMIGRPAFSRDGKHLAYTEIIQNGPVAVTIVETSEFRKVKQWEIRPLGDICDCAFDRTGTMVATHEPGAVTVWDAQSGTELARFEDIGAAKTIAFSPTADQLAIEDAYNSTNRGGRWGLDSRIHLINVDRNSAEFKQKIWTIEAGDNGYTHSIQFTPDGSKVLFNRRKGEGLATIIVNTQTGEVLREISPGGGFHHHMLSNVLPDGKTVVLVQQFPLTNFVMHVCDLENGRVLHSHPIDDLGGHASITIDPSGQVLFGGGSGVRDVRMFHIATGESCTPPLIKEESITDAIVQRYSRLSMNEQFAFARRELLRRNPKLDAGKIEVITAEQSITGVILPSHHVTDLSPLRVFPELYRLELNGDGGVNLSPFNDLSSLKGIPLRSLKCSVASIRDLTPLKGMPLTHLYIDNTLVSDLTPLAEMKLEELNISYTKVQSLESLKKMPLRILWTNHTDIDDLTPITGTKELIWLTFHSTKVSDLSPLLTLDMLSRVYLDYDKARDMKVLRSLKKLTMINDMSAADFWKKNE